jgi:hypothetical protein
MMMPPGATPVASIIVNALDPAESSGCGRRWRQSRGSSETTTGGAWSAV